MTVSATAMTTLLCLSEGIRLHSEAILSMVLPTALSMDQFCAVEGLVGSSLRDLGPPRRLTAASHVRYVLYVGYVRYVGYVTSTNGSRRTVLPTELVLGLSETVSET